jgi:zinc protease
VNVIRLNDSSPLVTLRVVFGCGAADDPAPGTAALTAQLLAGGGSRTHSYAEILQALFRMGVSFGAQVDKEMTTFAFTTHIDNLEASYELARAMLLDPGWRAEDFERLREDAVNYLEVGLRGQNDEELGKELLYQRIYRGHAYAHHNTGTVSSLRALDVADLRRFYTAHYSRENVTIALGGGFPAGFDERVRRDFGVLPLKALQRAAVPPPAEIQETEMLLVEKQARGVAISLGFPIGVRRGHPDYPALLVTASALGQHRMSAGRLFDRMRQQRGLNYGDYAYIEYFPDGMYRLEPAPNFSRSNDIFQLWIRPVEPGQAHFALRLALFELDRLVREGLTETEFERTRAFLSKYVNLLVKTRDSELGYAVDSAFYGTPRYPDYVRAGLAGLRLDQVNAAIGRHLRSERLSMVLIGEKMDDLRERILAGAPSPIEYASPKPASILEEDGRVARWPIPVRPERATVMAVEQAFA